MVQRSAGDVFFHRCATDDLRHIHDSGTAKRLLKGVVRLRRGSAPSRPHPKRDPSDWADTARRREQHLRWSTADLWAWLDLNQRPHPYQVSRAKRCADRRFPRSLATVRAKGGVLTSPSRLARNALPMAAGNIGDQPVAGKAMGVTPDRRVEASRRRPQASGPARLCRRRSPPRAAASRCQAP